MKKVVTIGLVPIALLALLWIGAYAQGGQPPVRPTRKPRPTRKWDATVTPTSTTVPTNTPEPACWIVVSKDILTDTIWQENCVYIADNGIYVHPGATLTIPEGTTLLMGSWKTLYVYGTLWVRGTKDRPVVIRRLYEDLSWTAIHLQSTMQLASDLTHLKIEGSYGAIRVVSGEVWITNCTIEGWRPFGDT